MGLTPSSIPLAPPVVSRDRPREPFFTPITVCERIFIEKVGIWEVPLFQVVGTWGGEVVGSRARPSSRGCQTSQSVPGRRLLPKGTVSSLWQSPALVAGLFTFLPSFQPNIPIGAADISH